MAAVKPGPEPTPWALDVGTRMLAELDRVMSSVSAGCMEAEVLAALGAPKRRSTGAGDALQFLVYAPFTLPDADFLSDTDIPVEVQLGFDVPSGGSEAVWAGSVVVTTESQNEIDPEDGLDDFRGAAEAMRRVLTERYGAPTPIKSGGPKHGPKCTNLAFQTGEGARRIELVGGIHYGSRTIQLHSTVDG